LARQIVKTALAFAAGTGVLFDLPTTPAGSAIIKLDGILNAGGFAAARLDCAALLAAVQRDELPVIVARAGAIVEGWEEEGESEWPVERALALGTRRCGHLQCTTVTPQGVAQRRCRGLRQG